MPNKGCVNPKRFSERFQKVFNSQLDAIFLLNSEIPARVLESNIAATEIFGYDVNEMVGDTIEKFHVDDIHRKAFHDKLFSAVQKEGYLKNFEFSMKRKDGSVFPSEHNILELKNDKDERTGWVSIIRDLTEKKKLEKRLHEAQKMESIGTLAGGIAHDFNNILFPIVGMSELLLEDLHPGNEAYENAEEILKAGKRGSGLVKQILAFSRQTDHKIMPIRIQNVLKEVLKLVRSTIPANIDIKHHIQTDCGVVNADATQMHQIAMNLITNAFHAVEDTDGKINVALKEIILEDEDVADLSLEPGKYAMFTVSDTGSGIEPFIVDKIFEPYFTTKERGKGTGLGLAVVYGIVKDHHGDIKVYSELNKGTTFKVYLPLMGKSNETVSIQREITYSIGNERILLVDDEKPIVQLEKQMLERLGYQVTTRTSSPDALQAFTAAPDSFDLVITDMSMPNMTGDRLAKHLIAIRPDIPIIISTGFSERINQEKAETIGIKGFLMKPIIKSEMAKIVRKVLDEAKSGSCD